MQEAEDKAEAAAAEEARIRQQELESIDRYAEMECFALQAQKQIVLPREIAGSGVC